MGPGNFGVGLHPIPTQEPPRYMKNKH